MPVLLASGVAWARCHASLPEGRYLAVPLEEDRILHVDGDRFTLGIPATTAFALAGLPPGRPFSLSGPLGDLACRPRYDDAALRQLAQGLVTALRRGSATRAGYRP